MWNDICDAGAEQWWGLEATVSIGQVGHSAASEAARTATGPGSAGGGTHTGAGTTERGGAVEDQAGKWKKEWRVAHEAFGGSAAGEEEHDQAAQAAPAGQPTAEGKPKEIIQMKI